ncbi:MAG: DUF4127 family protein [Armatimonadetes bacterium]|nr:DUF4127 family protein [Armatimonadota bacterium]
MTLRHRPHKVIYVPLDDRPYAVKHVRMLAEMVDYELIMPPLELLGRFTKPGQPEEIADWLLTEAQGGADAAILSLDMLAYGGLVASRSPLVRTQLALERLDAVTTLRQRAPEMQVLAGNVVMRLSITAASDNSALYWQLLRRYSELAGLVADCGKEAHQRELEQVKRRIPPDLLGQYLACRERNHLVNLKAVDLVAEGALDFLALTQEDASAHGLHKSEHADLEQRIAAKRLGAKVMLYPGADEVGQTLLARFVHQHMQKVPRVYVVPSNAAHMKNIAAFEDRAFNETLAANVKVIGGEMASAPEKADLVLAVNAPMRRPRDHYAAEAERPARRAKLAQFARRIAELNHHGLAICDAAFANGAEDDFVTALLAAGVEPLKLLSFGGWNTAGNSVGSALAQGTLRLIALQDKGAFDLANVVVSLTPMRYLRLLNSLIASERAHVGLLFYHLVDDWLYMSRVRPGVTKTVMDLLQASVFDLSHSHQQAEAIVREELTHAAADLWIEHFLGRQSVSIGSGDTRSGLVLAELDETRVRLPWRRLFEVDLDLEFGVQMVAEQ